MHLGSSTRNLVNNLANTIAIGYAAIVSNSNQIVLGTGTHTNLTCLAANQSLGVAGTALYINTSTGQIGLTTSSERYKTNIRPLSIDARRIYALTAKSWEYISDGSTDYGLIAEDVYKIIPSLVWLKTDTLGVTYPDGVHYDKLPVLLLIELQNHEKRIIELERLVGLLTKRIELLESK